MQTLFPSENNENKPPPHEDSTWVNLKNSLKSALSSHDYTAWIDPLIGSMTNTNELVITLPTMDFYQVILERFIDQFDECKNALGLDLFLRFEIMGHDTTASEVFDEHNDTLNELLQHQDDTDEERVKTAEQEKTSPVSRALTHHSQLNHEYTFDNFVNGPSNQFAHASCLAVADAPGQHYNPLFLYGSTGLGKTHLLHAVGNKVLKAKDNAVITYITSERFMNEMIYCLRFNKMWDFRRKYRNCDVLLVDDIQFISGKERTQEEFFHTFNALYESKKQIVVTSDIFPQDIPDIEDRLRNRFQWGLISDIQPPDVEHRVAILMNKAEKQGVILTSQVAEYIAHHAKGSVRVLEGALRRVAAFAALQGRDIDKKLASEILQDVLGDNQSQSVTIESIQKIVAEHFKVRVTDLKSKKRQRAISIPRQIAMFLSRLRTQCSFPEIGSEFGGKDHTTVMHAVKKIEKLRNNDLEIKTQLESLERKLDQIN